MATLTALTERQPTLTDPSVLSAIWLGVIGPQGILMMPFIVSSLAGRLHLSIAQSGGVASAALTGACVAGLLQAAIVRRFSWRWNAVLFATLLSASYAGLALAPSAAISVVLMFFAGSGMGALLALALTAIERSGQQTRGVGLMFGIQGVLGSMQAAIVPAPGVGNQQVVFFGLILASLSVLVAAPFIVQPPTHSRDANQWTRADRHTSALHLLLALIGWGCINFANGGFWPLIGELARRNGQDAGTIGAGVSAALALSIVGGFFAAALGERFGSRLPLIVIGSGTALSVTGIVLGSGAVSFVADMCVFGFLWNFGPPYQLPVVSRNDPSGRGMSFALVFMKLFMAVGPALYGLIAEHVGTASTGIVAAAVAVVSTILFVSLASSDGTPNRIK